MTSLATASSNASISLDNTRIHAQLLRFFDLLVHELGGDLNHYLRSLDIGSGAESDALNEISFRDQIRLLEFAAEQLACSDLGLRLAMKQSGSGIFGPLGEVMRSASTYGEALEYAHRHAYANSLATEMWLTPVDQERALFAGHEILLDRLPRRQQVMELIMLSGSLTAQELTGGKTRAKRVHLRHQPISSMQTYHRYFGCEIRFDEPHYGILFSNRDLRQPLITHDPSAFSDAAAFVETHFLSRRPPTHAKVRGLVLRRLGLFNCSNEAVAQILNMHPRTLHRHLRAEGTTFQRIKDEVRRDLLLYFLHQTDLDLVKISERLGFAEQSVMTRRCHAWFAASPSRIRTERIGHSVATH